MIKKIALFLVLQAGLFGSYIEEFEWQKGVFLSNFLEFHNIPASVYNDLSDEDKELAAEVKAGRKCLVLWDNNDQPLQFYIPVSSDLAMVIKKTKQKKWNLDFQPINYSVKSDILNIKIEKNPTSDIAYQTGNNQLANAFLAVFKSGVNFNNLRQGDKLVVFYDQKVRLGRPYGAPEITAAMIEERGKPKYRYLFKEKFYDEKGQEVTKQFLFAMPIIGAKVRSKFTLKRFHPILKKYRAHLGTDYAAPSGTKIMAAGDGTVKSVGWQNGYGNTVEISHSGGYKTLYAHMKSFAKGIKKGQSIKQGTVIGYVGSTGLSTGPHLHMGLYKNGSPMDFQKAVHIEKKIEKTPEQKEFEGIVAAKNAEIKKAIDNNVSATLIFDNYEIVQDL